VPLLTLEECPKEWKHHSKVNSWKSKTVQNVKVVIRGNLLEPITARNADFAFLRWIIIAPGLTIA